MTEIVEDYTAILAYLDNDSRRWNAFTDVGTSVIVTYSFLETDELPDGSAGYYGVDSFAAFNETQRGYMRDVIAEAASVSGVIFVEVEEGRAMINMYSGLDGDGGGVSASGYAGYGVGALNTTYDSDLVMVYQDFTPGGFTYQVLLHELGHSMGLSHTHQGEHVLTEDTDHNYNSVMTYTSTWDHSEIFGPYDVAALSHLYGDVASTADFKTTIDRDGLIVVVASDRDDKLIAADIGSKLVGKQGDDLLFGREGQDILSGGKGNDALQGGLGDDILSGQRDNDKITGDTGDTFYGGDDTIAGGQGKDRINGNGGDDRIDGNAGHDILIGEYGQDRIGGGRGNDKITGGAEDDRMTGGLGDDVFVFSGVDYGDTDVITDFMNGEDMLDFTALADMTQNDLTITQIGADTQVDTGGYGVTVVLENFASSDLSFDNIAFA